MWYEIIKKYYEKGIYTDVQLETFVAGGMITEEQIQEIVASKVDV